MDAFDKAAEKKTPAGERLLECIAKAKADLRLAEAAERGDWTETARLYAAGADPSHRDRRAIKALAESDTIAAADILETQRSPMYGTPMIVYALQKAVEKSNLTTVTHIIAKNPSTDILNHGICAALLAKQDEAAELLLRAVPEKDLNDKALFGLLTAQPAEYARLTAEPGRDCDYLMHFLNACARKDKAAIDTSLDKMLADQETTRRHLEMMDMDMMDMGTGVLREVTGYVFASGHIPAIDKFIDSFQSHLMPDFLLLHAALAASAEEAHVFPHIVEKLGIKPDMVSLLLMHGAIDDRRPAARFLMEFTPEAAKEACYPLLRVFATADTPQEFFDALAKGIPLPADEKGLAQLWIAATEAGNEKIAAHIEAANGPFTPAQIAELQKSASTDIILKAAQLGGDWHARGDALYWRAASEGRQDILDAFPKTEKFQAALSYQLEYAIEGFIKRGDTAGLEDMFARTPWDEGLRKKAEETLIQHPQFLPLLQTIGCAARPLTDKDAHGLVKGGVAAIEWLGSHGYGMDDKTAVATLEIAARQNARDMLEYLLGRGIRMEEAERLPAMIGSYADDATLSVIEKWLRRDQGRPDPGLDARITQTAPEDVFSLGVAAAYADAFGAVMQRASESAKPFDPAVLGAKDETGNSILDILGAHGKLNDILVPSLWRDKDAVAFVNDNVPPCYRDQCDFHGLKAALDQLRLKEMGKRAKLGLKGP